MRVIKTLNKQLELAAAGKLLILGHSTGGYVRVSAADVLAMRNEKFYARVQK